MRSADTSPEAHRVHLEAYRRMGPARRVEMAAAMSEEIWQLAADGIKARHPDYDEQTVTWAVRRMRLGDDLFHKVWPGAPLLAP